LQQLDRVSNFVENIDSENTNSNIVFRRIVSNWSLIILGKIIGLSVEYQFDVPLSLGYSGQTFHSDADSDTDPTLFSTYVLKLIVFFLADPTSNAGSSSNSFLRCLGVTSTHV
jgi:hypothetical protein